MLINYKVYLSFEGASLQNFTLFFEKHQDSGTLNNFYRGKFEIQNALLEHLETGERFFYIEFEMGDKFEISAMKAFLSFDAAI